MGKICGSPAGFSIIRMDGKRVCSKGICIHFDLEWRGMMCKMQDGTYKSEGGGGLRWGKPGKGMLTPLF